MRLKYLSILEEHEHLTKHICSSPQTSCGVHSQAGEKMWSPRILLNRPQQIPWCLWNAALRSNRRSGWFSPALFLNAGEHLSEVWPVLGGPLTPQPQAQQQRCPQQTAWAPPKWWDCSAWFAAPCTAFLQGCWFCVPSAQHKMCNCKWNNFKIIWVVPHHSSDITLWPVPWYCISTALGFLNHRRTQPGFSPEWTALWASVFILTRVKEQRCLTRDEFAICLCWTIC